MKNFFPINRMAGATLGLLASAAYAQTPSVPTAPRVAAPAVGMQTATTTGFEASGIPSSGIYAPKSLRLLDGGLLVTPTMGISLGYNDNVALEPTNKRSSSFISFAPQIIGTSAYRANRYSFGYTGEVVRYFDSSKDSIENHEVAATGMHGLDTRTTVNWRASILDRYDPVGSTNLSALSDRPDHWQGANVAAAVRYGAEGAKGRIQGEVGYFHKRYQNNRAFTEAADYDSTNASIKFYNRVAPKTHVLAEYRYTGFDYKQNTSNQDNAEQRLLVGAEWEATAATTGSAKVGYLRKEFKQVRPTYSGVTWEAAVRWAPLTYTQVDFTTGRAATDPSGTSADFVVASFYNAAWTHNWNSFVATKVSVGHNRGAYNRIGRRDQSTSLGLGVSYDFRQWVRFGANYAYSKRNSNDDLYDFTRNLFSLTAEISF